MTHPTLKRALDVLREHGRADLAEAVEAALREAGGEGRREAEELVRELRLKVRAAKAGCLDRCYGAPMCDPTLLDPRGHSDHCPAGIALQDIEDVGSRQVPDGDAPTKQETG